MRIDDVLKLLHLRIPVRNTWLKSFACSSWISHTNTLQQLQSLESFHLMASSDWLIQLIAWGFIWNLLYSSPQHLVTQHQHLLPLFLFFNFNFLFCTFFPAILSSSSISSFIPYQTHYVIHHMKRIHKLLLCCLLYFVLADVQRISSTFITIETAMVYD